MRIRGRATLSVAFASITALLVVGDACPVSAAPTVAAKPAPASQDVELAEQLYAKLDFEQANTVADRALKQRGLTHDQLVRATKVLALTHAVLDHEEQSRDAFIQLLAYDADFQLDQNLGPKVSAPFLEARGFWRAQSQKPGISTTTLLRTNETGSLKIVTRDPTHLVKKLTVGYRWASSGEFTVVPANVGEGSSVDVPAPPTGKTRLDYFVQAADDRDDIVFENGSPQVPKSAFAEGGALVATSKGSSVFASPIFWIAAGVVVAGGATAAYFATRPGEPTSATLRAVPFCGTERCN